MVDDKQLKAAKKEGGKKGVDAAGMSDLGGVKYFHITVDTPEGNLDLLKAVLEVRESHNRAWLAWPSYSIYMPGGCIVFWCLSTPIPIQQQQGMNAEVDEASEERKGGAGNLAKMLLSAGKDTLLILVHVPAALAAEKGLNAKEWAEVVLKPVDGSIVSEEGDVVVAEVKGDPEKVQCCSREVYYRQQRGTNDTHYTAWHK